MLADEIELHCAIDRAAKAKAVLEDGVIADAFTALEAAYIDAWRLSDPRDDDGRERLWQALQIVGKVRSHLQAVIANGSIARAELEV